MAAKSGAGSLPMTGITLIAQNIPTVNLFTETLVLVLVLTKILNILI